MTTTATTTIDHHRWAKEVKEASERALKECQRYPLPKIFTQIPELCSINWNPEILTRIKHTGNEIKGAIIDERIWRSQLMNPAEAGFSFTRYSEDNPRSEIYPSSGDYWKCHNCSDRGDRWYMLDHICGDK
jgi:hypothetical protein